MELDGVRKKFMLNLRKRRKELGYSTGGLSAELGGCYSLISSYENGRKFPMMSNLVKLCEILDTTPDWLLGYRTEGLD